MTHSPSLEDLVNALLGDASLAQNLTENDKATIRAMVQALTGDLQGELQTAFRSSTGVTPQHDSTDGLMAELDTFLSELDGIPFMQSTPDPLDQHTDSALVEVLGSHVESAGSVVEVLSTRRVTQHALNALRRVELQLTALTIGVGDLRQALEQNLHPQPLRRCRRSIAALIRRLQFHHSGASLVKPQHIALFTLMICIPLGLKLGVPTLLHQAERAGWFEKLEAQPSSLNKVESIQNGILLVKSSAGATLRVKLAGLELDEHWQTQADGIMAMLLQPARAQVVLGQTQIVQNGITDAIVTLPNGISLQEILLSDGLAKLSLNKFNRLPENLVLKLKQAEANAKRQHKNLWGDPPNASAH
ncbi:hypothetical protein IQ250_06025 [Pseudanabaenaceae cyanobacterium LEGE 13415]|nr:hypothetical protein [Pseudanabaenaceae cyanobacterium LEGE 13415]